MMKEAAHACLWSIATKSATGWSIWKINTEIEISQRNQVHENSCSKEILGISWNHVSLH